MRSESDGTGLAAQLFQDLWRPLCRYLLTLGLSREEVEETAQETFLRLHQHIDCNPNHEHLRGWVFRVGHNLAQNERRNRQRRGSVSLTGFKEELADQRPPADWLVFENDRMQRVGAALRALPPEQAHCLHLRAEGLKYREIAEILGVSVATVGNLVERALKVLEKEIR